MHVEIHIYLDIGGLSTNFSEILYSVAGLEPISKILIPLIGFISFIIDGYRPPCYILNYYYCASMGLIVTVFCLFVYFESVSYHILMLIKA